MGVFKMAIFHKIKFFISFNLFFLISFFHWSTSHASANKPPVSANEQHRMPSVNVTINNGAPSATATNSNATAQGQLQKSLQIQDQRSFQDVNVKHLINWPSLPSLPDGKPIKDFFTATYDSIRSHPYACMLVVLTASYALINYQICKTNHLLQEYDAWCNWKSVIPLTHLQLTCGQDLLAQLKIDFYKKYALIASNASSCDYTNMFISDIKNELILLNNYIYWYELTNSIKCSRLFYFKYDISVIQDKKTRLLFILDFFMAWYSKNHENIAYPN